MANTNALAIGDFSVRQLDGLFSLNDLHKASGNEDRHQPALFVRLDQTQALIAEIGNSTDMQSLRTATGRNGGTYACRELVIAYAAWISPAFHLKVIRVFLNATTTAIPDRITPAQAQHLKELVDIIVSSGKQDYPSTWARFQRKFKINKYELLHPSQFDAACEYLKGKMDGQSMAALVQKHFPDATKMVPAQQQLQLDAPEQLAPNTYQKLCEGQVREALNMGLVMAGYVQQAVAKAVLRGGDDWKQLRWIVSFVTDNKYAAPVMVDRIEPDAIMVRNTELDQLASACNNLLAQRMQLAAN